jgi:hypothetical protein
MWEERPFHVPMRFLADSLFLRLSSWWLSWQSLSIYLERWFSASAHSSKGRRWTWEWHQMRPDEKRGKTGK